MCIVYNHICFNISKSIHEKLLRGYEGPRNKDVVQNYYTSRSFCFF